MSSHGVARAAGFDLFILGSILTAVCGYLFERRDPQGNPTSRLIRRIRALPPLQLAAAIGFSVGLLSTFVSWADVSLLGITGPVTPWDYVFYTKRVFFFLSRIFGIEYP